MKKLVMLLAIFLVAGKSFAADLFVREFGAGGAYSTITAALEAASDGDRIIVTPKTANIPYVESFAISKAITIKSSAPNQRITLLGKIVISVAAAGKSVSLINIKITGADSRIENSGNAASGDRTIVNIMNCDLGIIRFVNDNYFINMVNSIVGSVEVACGNIIGCDITDRIYLAEETGANSAAFNDHMYIVGNKIAYRVDIQSKHPFNFSNNYFKYSSGGIEIHDVNYTTQKNCIIGNNFLSFAQRGIDTNNSKWNNNALVIRNNYFNSAQDDYDIYNSESAAEANIQVYFNASNNRFLAVQTTQSNNVENLAIQIDNTAGNYNKLIGGALNAGHPANIFYDLDLTRNDLGHYGGSFSFENFWPANVDPGAPRVYMVDLPRVIYTGETIDVKAEAYSK